MPGQTNIGRRARLVWLGLALVLAAPLCLAATSPLLAWRDPAYIIGGFAGIVGFVFLLVQPLLAGAILPGLRLQAQRRLHRWVGAGLVLAVLIHVAGLWITSPPDVVDVLLFRSPTPFAVWGVAAMWAVFATACFAMIRKRLRIRWRSWRVIHSVFAVVIVLGSVMHALLIEGTMEAMSKWALSALIVIASLRVLADRATLARMLKRA